MAANHVLKIDCADEKGLVHKVTGVLYRKNLNIVSNGEFVDHENRRFFMRTEYSGDADSLPIIQELAAALPKGASIELSPVRKKNIVILVTREHHCLADLLTRHAFGELHANVLAVVSNHSHLKRLAGQFEVPYHAVPHEKKSRKAHEAAVLRVLSRYRPEFIVLAKYMRILSPPFVRKFENRILNIHHSFLPAFLGAHPYQQAAARGVKIIGATAHFVNEKLDKGPIIAQDVVAVDHSHSVSDMTLAGHDVEKIVLAKALRLVFEDRIFVSGNKTVIFD
ncbi:MAG: formyltetrahydrofolate deformylase [Candidatus Omnitrophota bacterium]